MPKGKEAIPHVVVGELATPTEAQNVRAEKNGGWQEREINGVTVMWNSCVSPPFASHLYNFGKST